MARIPNLSKVTRDIDNSEYDIKRIKHYYQCDGMGIDLSEETNKVNYVNYIETIIRKSIEYKEFITFLRDNIDMTRCAYFNKVTNKYKGIKIEVHHAPFTLHDITYIVLQKFIDEGIDINTADIAEYVLSLHYQGLVGLIPLSKTVHELVHAGQIFVPINYVYGDIGKFYMEYNDYMTEPQKDALYKNIAVCDELQTSIPKVLKKKFVYLDVEGMVLPHYVREVRKNKKKNRKDNIKMRKVILRRVA